MAGGDTHLNAFTEHGAIMAATVLNSERAVEMSVFMVRAFVRLREMLATIESLQERSTNWRIVWTHTIPRFRI